VYLFALFFIFKFYLVYLKLLSDQPLPLNTEQLIVKIEKTHNSSSYFH